MGCLLNDGNPATARGLCLRCRQRQDRQIKAGLTTDAELVRKGLRLPSKKQANLNRFRRRRW